ncbi:MAG TPA: hypothetical protein VK284_15135 [Streptosporangiaceae bacterium]|nr:hypothetical protein [Streptosporangiaceae bacterium]HLN66001.1 hypothetical protein [Streptosporangiaceae bacterium]
MRGIVQLELALEYGRRLWHRDPEHCLVVIQFRAGHVRYVVVA